MKKGFTLIELLAVIVILSIIALIAVPIIINIIDDSKKSSSLRSAEFYLDAVEVSIANRVMEKGKITDGTYPITQEGNICLGVLTQNTCSSDVLKVKVNGESPKSGTITIIDGKIKLVNIELNNKVVVKNTEEELVYSACKLIEDNGSVGITIGDKYQCKVKDTMPEGWEDGYVFYVLGLNEDGKANLIMDQNINSDGTPAGTIKIQKEGDNVYNQVDWISEEDYGCGVSGDKCSKSDKGPITAVNYLYDVTKDWTNIPAINYTYYDKKFSGNRNGYTSFISTNGIAVITPISGNPVTIGTKEEPLRARMPIYTIDKNNSVNNEVTSKAEETSFMYLNLNLSVIHGYWTLSSYHYLNTHANMVYRGGGVDGNNVYSANGVRPVITLEI